MRNDTRVEESKFEFGLGVARLDSGEFPWGYGENRITAIVRDPDSAYLYWEATDEAIAAARARLGPAGAGSRSRVPYGVGRDRRIREECSGRK